MLQAILEKARTAHTLSKDEIIFLLSLADARALFAAADEVRRKFVGDEVYLRGLIEFSNYCKNDCLYCGIRRSNAKAERYRLTPEQIVQTARRAQSYGYKTIVLQSGEDGYFTADKMAEIIRQIKALGLVVTLSIGEKTREEYALYRAAGADRYLLRIETTDKKLYEKLDPQMSFENRVRCLYDLKDLGYEVGSGSLVGLPEQSLESLADDLLFFKKLPVDMAGIGPFIPHPDTPLAAANKAGHFELSLKMMAVMRLLLPDINIPATTAMETLRADGRTIALQSGANVVMPNVTEGPYRAKYALYPNKICVGEHPETCAACIRGKIVRIGRKVEFSTGFRGEYLKKQNPRP